MSKIMSMEERYLSDPKFHKLVELMYHQIAEAEFTPTEIREAAMYATIKFEHTHSRCHFYNTGH